MTRVTVFWEDSRGGARKGYGPDALLRACVADDLGLGSLHQVRNVDSCPCNGNTEVVKRIAQVGKRGAPYPALFTLDSDKIARLLGDLKRQPVVCTSGRKLELRQYCEYPEATIAFVEGNTEDVIVATQSVCAGIPELESLPWIKAVKKCISSRDWVLNAVAQPEYVEVRTSLRRTNRSVDYLVTSVRLLLAT